MWKHTKWLWAVLGSAASGVALISLVQRVGEIELAASLGCYLDYYRDGMRTFADLVPLPNGWRIEQWYLDSLVVNGVVCASVYRTLVVTYERQHRFLRAMFVAFLFVPGGGVLALFVMMQLRYTWLSSIPESQEYLRELAHWKAEAAARGGAIPKVYDDEMQKAHDELRRANRLRHARLLFVLFLLVTLSISIVFFALNGQLLQSQTLAG